MPHALVHRACRRGSLLALGLVLLAGPAVAQNGILEQEEWARPPEPIASAVTAPRHLNVTLSSPSPDNRFFLKQQSEGMPTMADFAREHMWLGGLQIDPRANRARNFSTRGAAGLSLIEWETGRTIDVQVPRGATVTGPRWSPDGRSLAYFANFDDGTHIYIADVGSGRSRQLTRSHVLATLHTSFEWTSDGRSIVTVLVPDNRGPAPREPAVPIGPQVRLSRDGENRLRTYNSLIEWPWQMNALEYYATGQLAMIDVASRRVQRIGEPAMFRNVDAGPNGDVLRVTIMQKPFSYLVPVNSYGQKEELWTRDGRVIATLSERPLNEGIRRQQGGQTDDDQQQDGPTMRGVAWRPDGAGISYLEQEPAPEQPEGQAQRQNARRRDRVMLWAPPYDENSRTVVYESDTRMSSVRWSADARMIVVSEGTGNNAHLYAVFLDDPSTRHTIARGAAAGGGGGGFGGGGGGAAARAADSLFYNPVGSLMTRSTPQGWSAVRTSPDGRSIYLSGTQYFRDPMEQAPREFVDRLELATGTKTRIYEADNNGVFERILSVLEDDFSRIIVSRESPTQVPDSYLREGSQLRKLTDNVDYTPEVTRAERRRFTVARPDGFSFKVDVTLPPDYRPGTRLPAMFWFYPREYTEQEGYDRTLRTFNKNRFPAQGARSMELLTLLGYAVVQPDAPITGPQGRMNDNYVHDLRNNLLAVIDHLDREGIIDRERLGIGGHSYGAFSTVNAMVHTPFFKAGIAGDGAYNRTLTPLGFQSEQRDFWSARETYLSMSPFVYANNLTGALLMYHGADDQNVGTHLINSQRLFHALNGLGKTTSLYIYPYEDHGPATLETHLDLWARWVEWLDTHVKNAKRDEQRITTQQ